MGMKDHSMKQCLAMAHKQALLSICLDQSMGHQTQGLARSNGSEMTTQISEMQIDPFNQEKDRHCQKT